MLKSNKFWIFSGLVIVVALALVFLFVKYENLVKKIDDPSMAQKKYLELSKLVLEKRDYGTVIKETNTYLAAHPNDEKMLYLNAVSKFDTQKFDEAKLVFQKIISLNPDNKSAKKYLEILASGPNQIIVSEEGLKKLALTKEEFEDIIKVNLDNKILIFSKAQHQPENSGYKSIYAVYTFSQKPSEINSYLNKTFGKFNPNSTSSNHLELKLSDKEVLGISIYAQVKQVVFDYTKQK